MVCVNIFLNSFISLNFPGAPAIPSNLAADVETLRAMRAMARFQVRVAQDKVDDLEERKVIILGIRTCV